MEECCGSAYSAKWSDEGGCEVRRTRSAVLAAVLVLGAFLFSSVAGAGASRSFDAGSGWPSVALENRAPLSGSDILLSDTRLDFGAVPYGQGAGLQLVISNVGTGTLPTPTFVSVRTKGADGDAFFVDSDPAAYPTNGCPNATELGPGSFCLFNLQFYPVNATRSKYRGSACFDVADERSQVVCIDLIGTLDRSV